MAERTITYDDALWVMVPRTLSHMDRAHNAICLAGERALKANGLVQYADYGTFRAIWDAMLAAAPPPTSEGSEVSASYAYIRRTYGVEPTPGRRVRHQITNRHGLIVRPRGDPHYVQVRFDGQKHTVPCHPTELDYSAEEAK